MYLFIIYNIYYNNKESIKKERKPSDYKED